MSFKPLVSVCVLSSALLVPLHAAPTDPVAIVNGKTITQQDYDGYAKVRTKQTHGNVAPDRKILVEDLIQRELLRQDALRLKLHKHSEFIQKLKTMRNNLLMEMVMQDYLEKHPLDNAALKNKYDNLTAHLKANEYKVRHILVKRKAEAKTIIAELAEGKAFGKLASEKSKDAGSAEEGGDLGWITQSSVVPKFGAALVKLEKGKYTTNPVKSKFGWHIIQLDDVRSVALPSFKSVKERIRAALQSQQMQEYAIKLREKANVKMIKK
jgi:peptidyl-prolyl cis-trans isomerase C